MYHKVQMFILISNLLKGTDCNLNFFHVFNYYASQYISETLYIDRDWETDALF